MSYIKCNTNCCVGCLACVTACLDQHYEVFETDPVSPRRYTLQVSEKTGMTCYKTGSCYHCKDAACMKACDQDALFRDERGYIRVKTDDCIGCGACEEACQHHMILVNKAGKAIKCDGCSVRIASGLKPACLRVCPVAALTIEE